MSKKPKTRKRPTPRRDTTRRDLADGLDLLLEALDADELAALEKRVQKKLALFPHLLPEQRKNQKQARAYNMRDGCALIGMTIVEILRGRRA